MDNGRAGQIIRFNVPFLRTNDNLMPGHKVGRVSRMLNTGLIGSTPRATSSSGIPAKELVKQLDNSPFRGAGDPRGGPPRPAVRGREPGTPGQGRGASRNDEASALARRHFFTHSKAGNHLHQQLIDSGSPLCRDRNDGFSARPRGFCSLPVNGSLRVPRAYPLWLLLFVGLQIADIVTTNHALALPGVWEANPLMAWSQAQLGAFWWLPKLAVAGYLSLSAPFMRRRWPMIFAVSVSGLCVLGNLANF